MKTLFFTYLIFSLTVIKAGNLNHNPDRFADPWISGGWKEPSGKELETIISLPVIEFNDDRTGKELPYQVDNTIKTFFRPVFTQVANECGQASGIGYTLTYELNYMKDLNANFDQNRYPTYFTFNFLNGGNEENGSTYFGGWDIAKSSGCPYIIDYGGMTPSNDPDLRDILWMNGFDKYERAMENRVCEVLAIPVGTPDGLKDLKKWLYDRGDGSPAGGIANFSAGVYFDWRTGYLPWGSPHEGEFVITKWNYTVNHAMTIAGYNDSIRFDINGDGKFTNDTDITGDGLVDMKDWETGALLMVNSWGMEWGNSGKAWVMYSSLGYEHWEGGIWTKTAHTVTAFDTFKPLLKIRTELEYPRRINLTVFAGISSDTLSQKPEKVLNFPILTRSGGAYPMTGVSDIIGLGFDVSSLASDVENGSFVKLFLGIDEYDKTSSNFGSIRSMTAIDEWGNETLSKDTMKLIADNDTTYASVIIPVYTSRPLIVNQSLPEALCGTEYNFELMARGGTEPYKWNFLIDYQEFENGSVFPSGEFARFDLPNDNPDNDIIPVKLDFEFPFYGIRYDSIFVSTDGYISFVNKFLYIWDMDSFVLNRVAASHAADLTCYPQDGNGVFYQNNGSSFTILWIASLRSDPSAKLRFACTLKEDGSIDFYHDENTNAGSDWICGISAGDGINLDLSKASGSVATQPFNSSFAHPPFPYGIDLSGSGFISGIIDDCSGIWPVTVKVTDWNGLHSSKEFMLSSSADIDDFRDKDYLIIKSFPNPFNPSTNISFDLETDTKASLIIYDLKGNSVAEIFDNKYFEKGHHDFRWDPQDLPSGVYFGLLKSDNRRHRTLRMLLLK